MEVYKAVFDIENNLISKTKCNLDDVFGSENFDYQDYWCADDLHILKDNLNEGIYFLIDNYKSKNLM